MLYRKPVRLLSLVLIVGWIAACTLVRPGSNAPVTSPYPEPPIPIPPLATYPEPAATSIADWTPRPGDEELLRGEVFIDDAQLLTLESYPPQYMLSLKGNLPTPCHQLRVRVPSPDKENRIQVEVYSLSKPTEICIQVLAPFTANVPINGLPTGQYAIEVNGEDLGAIQIP